MFDSGRQRSPSRGCRAGRRVFRGRRPGRRRRALRAQRALKGLKLDEHDKQIGVDIMVTAGVIDPTKVARTALQNAASLASLLLTTEALIVEKKEDRPAPAGPPGGGMGGMY